MNACANCGAPCRKRPDCAVCTHAPAWQRAARRQAAPPSLALRCWSWHGAKGRCVEPAGHYRSHHEPFPSPHRAADGTTWYGVAHGGTSPGTAVASIGPGSLAGGERARREAFTTNPEQAGRRRA